MSGDMQVSSNCQNGLQELIGAVEFVTCNAFPPINFGEGYPKAVPHNRVEASRTAEQSMTVCYSLFIY